MPDVFLFVFDILPSSCFQDTSLVNPDLLQEARRFIGVAHIGDIENNLRRGVLGKDLQLLLATTALAAEIEVRIHFPIFKTLLLADTTTWSWPL